jgi:hypothetical protein
MSRRRLRQRLLPDTMSYPRAPWGMEGGFFKHLPDRKGCFKKSELFRVRNALGHEAIALAARYSDTQQGAFALLELRPRGVNALLGFMSDRV